MTIDYQKVKTRALQKRDSKKLLNILHRHEGYKYDECELEDLEGEEESDYYIGAFYKNKLIGYMQLDSIWEGGDEILSYPGKQDDDYYVSNLFVDEEYRGNYVGYVLLGFLAWYTTRPVFLIAKTESLVSYYEKFGFRHMGGRELVFEPKEEFTTNKNK